jgi:hypothetical protein
MAVQADVGQKGERQREGEGFTGRRGGGEARDGISGSIHQAPERQLMTQALFVGRPQVPGTEVAVNLDARSEDSPSALFLRSPPLASPPPRLPVNPLFFSSSSSSQQAADAVRPMNDVRSAGAYRAHCARALARELLRQLGAPV